MKITVHQAAKLLNKSPLFVYCGLRSGKLPIGTAYQLSGKQYTYHISPGKLAEYMGMSIEDIRREL